MKGTRTAILNKIHDWAADLDAPNILWLKGHPGVGKSAIAAEVVDQLATLGRLGSSFFFQRQKAAELTPHALWRTVSYNLARRHPLVRKAVLLKLEEEVISPGTPNLEGLFLHFIREPLMGSTGIPNSRLPIIVIDALDECGGLEGQQSVYRKGLMKTLRNWSELPTKFKLIVTSRGENDIERLFSTTRHHLIEILAGDTVDAQSSEDIKMFLIEELQSIAAQYHLSLPQTNWPDAQIIDLLVIRAAGLFIWAQTVTRFISLGQPKRRLNQVLEGKAKGSIDSLYDQILGTFFSSEEDMQDFHTVVGAIILMKAPLTLTSLAHLLSMDESDVEHICIRLQSVLEYHNHLHFYHQSFVDFLLDHDRCTLGFAIEPDRENRHLALACLRVLNNELRFNLCRVESSHFRNVDIPDLTSRAEKFIPPHLLYSSLWWTRHLSETAFDTEIFERVQCFMHEQFLFWLEVLSISQQMNLGSQTLSSLINWIQPHDDRGTIDLAKDMQKFVVTFAAAISQSVTHIYISALPFSPPVSAVRNHYKPKYPRTLMIQSGGLTHWPALLHVLMGHTDEVTSAVISSDGKRIFSGSRDNTIRIWDAETGEVVVVPLKGHSDRIKSTSFSLDGKRVVSGSDDRTIRVWDIETGETITGPLEGHTKEITSVAISPDGKRIVSGSKDTTVRVWDAKTGAIITSPLKSHTSWVSSVAFSPDGRRIVSGSWDETIRVWDAETGAVITGPLKIHDGVVNSVAFSPDGKFIASGSSDKTIQVYDTEIGAVATGSLKGHTDEIFSIAFSRDGKRIVSGSNDTTIRVWDTRTGAVVIGPLKGHNNRVTSIAFSLDGRRIISGSWDKTIQVWDVETAAIVSGPLDGHIDGVTSVAISPDGKHIASGSWDRTIRVWSAEAGAAVTGPLEGHSDWIKSVAFSPDGKRIVSGSSDETIRVWDVNTGAILTGPLEDTSSLVNSVNSVAFSPDGERIISGSEDGKIRLWDVKTGVILLVFLDGHSREVTSVIFSPDGKRIASGSKDKTIRVWDVDTGATVAGPLEDHSDWVKSVAFSPDGERIVSGSNDKTIRVWDIKAGTVLIGPLLGHNGAIRSVAFSPDGKWIVSGSSDTIVRVWDVETGALVTGPLEGHNSDVNSVAFSPDGRHIISGSSDGVIRQWNCLPYETQDSSPCPPEFSPSSRMVDGWVLGPKSELLFWVPPMLRPGLCWPTNTLVITRDIVTRLQLKNFVSGNAWGLCKA
ncbi:hypothetical protein M408DRAFT_252169 [Serendipita vermifera MAFF 305830]|uniref:Uncharacterized protein n=1 Tax=Serendipita vermifera MAFF 305830 TaxID=933852 RepID=A0A0C2WB41_SERVB|nr:hypothetical protein M408DRAFT_252169 [Serendipita vermifera MAFF 305830]